MTPAPKRSPASPAVAREQTKIEMVFDRIAATYGTRFTDMWAGLNPEKVKGVWGAAIEKYDRDVILGAFKTLEREHPHPPTLPQFLAACEKNVRVVPVLKLTEPRVSMPKWIAQQFAEFRRTHVFGKRDE
jgi:hypothetical protein